jgi:hypothetical protein
MLLTIILILAAVILVFAGIVAMQPADYRVSRTATISAPPATVFSQVNDFHNWKAWSPWAKLDPNALNTFQGPDAGTGSIFSWAGNNKVGEGRMTITESRPNELVKIALEFVKPFRSNSTSQFAFRPENGHTVVTWSMDGKNNFIAKAFCMFMNMDKMLGGEFEKGLADMKKVAEAGKTS